MTLGQEFSTYAVMLAEDEQRLKEVARVAVKLSNACNDLRLLSSGPRLLPLLFGGDVSFRFVGGWGGRGRATLKVARLRRRLQRNQFACRASALIDHAGKVNPGDTGSGESDCYEVIRNNVTVSFVAEAGQLQLNAFEPIIAHSLFKDLKHLRNGCLTLAERCVKGITANREHLRRLVEHSIGIVTALNPYIGYERATAVAKEAHDTGKSVYELVLAKGWLSKGAAR